MKIELINISDNITVPHSLLLVRGKIVNSGYTCENVVHIRKKDSNKTTQWPVVKRHFVAYFELDKGCNILIINSNSSQLQFRVNYHPQNLTKFVRPVYIVCKDDVGNFQAPQEVDNSVESARDRIKLGAQMLQLFMAESLNFLGFGRKTFSLESDQRGKPFCSTFRCSLTREEAQKIPNENQLWKRLGSELMTSSFSEKSNCKFLAFVSFTEYKNTSNHLPNNHSEVLRMTKGHSALGGGGLALFGTGCLHTWPEKVQDIISCFSDERLIDKMNLMDDSAHRGSYWACYSTGLGAALHELGHTFDLGHNQWGIMSRGFDDMNQFFSLTQNNQFSEENANRENKDEGLKLCQNEASMFTNSWSRSNWEKLPWGGAIWYRSSAILLAYHKWFNNYSELDNKNYPSIKDLTVTAQNGIRLIEIRDKSESIVIHFCEFTKSCELTKKFIINRKEVIKRKNDENSYVIVIQDGKGNIVKTKLDL